MEFLARLQTSFTNLSESISKYLDDCELYAVAILPSFSSNTDKPNPKPVPDCSIITSFEFKIRVFPSLALNPVPVTSHPESKVFEIVSFKKFTDSSRLKSLNFLSYVFLTSGTFPTSENP